MVPATTAPSNSQDDNAMEVDSVQWAPINYVSTIRSTDRGAEMTYSTNSGSTNVALISPPRKTGTGMSDVIPSFTYSHHSRDRSNAMDIDRPQLATTRYPNYPMRPQQAGAVNNSCDVPMRSIERNTGYSMQGVTMTSDHLVRPVETDMVRRARNRLFNVAARPGGNPPVPSSDVFQSAKDAEMMDALMELLPEISLVRSRRRR